MSRSLNEMAAGLAVQHVKRMVPLGASNRADNVLQEKARDALNLSRLDREMERVLLSREYVTTGQVALAAKISGAGNCADQSSVAMRFLEGMNMYPLDLMGDTYNDHAFVVIGRLVTSDSSDASTWGPEAVVCDPWSGISGRVDNDSVAAMLIEYPMYESQFQVLRPAHKSATRESPF